MHKIAIIYGVIFIMMQPLFAQKSNNPTTHLELKDFLNELVIVSSLPSYVSAFTPQKYLLTTGPA